MRMLSIIFTCYLFLLMAGPCCVLDTYARHTTDECCKTLPVPDNQHPEQQAACSPFYACASCTGFTVQSDFRFEIIRGIAHPFPLASELSVPVKYSGSIWQPPKTA